MGANNAVINFVDATVSNSPNSAGANKQFSNFAHTNSSSDINNKNLPNKVFVINDWYYLIFDMMH